MSIIPAYIATFTPSGSPVSILAQPFNASIPSAVFALPAYDASNLDLLVTSTATGPVTLSFAGGGVTVPPGATMLLTAVAATMANTQNPLVASMAALGSSATTATAISANGSPGTVVVQRGTAVSKPVF